jgi:replicative DNA helicase
MERPFKAVLPETLRLIERRYDMRDAQPRVRTGLRSSDGALDTLRPAQFVAVAGADPSACAALVVQALRHAASKGEAVFLCSPGVPASAWAEWLICAEAGLERWRVRSGEIGPEEWLGLTQALASLSEWRIHVDDGADLLLDHVHERCLAWCRAEGVGREALVVLDRLDMLVPRAGLLDASRRARELAVRIDMPVLARIQGDCQLEDVDADVLIRVVPRPQQKPAGLELTISPGAGRTRTVRVAYHPDLIRVDELADRKR